MSFNFPWTNRKNNQDYVLAEDVNALAGGIRMAGSHAENVLAAHKQSADHDVRYYTKQQSCDRFANALIGSTIGSTIALTDIQPGATEARELTIYGKTLEEPPNLIPEDKRKFEGWNTYGGSVITLTQGQSVPDWNTTEATRIQTSGGSTTLKCYFDGGSAAKLGIEYSCRVYVKNIGDVSVWVGAANHNDTVVILPGESKLVEVTDSAASVGLRGRLHFYSVNVEDSLDFIAYQPEAYEHQKSPDNPYILTGAGESGTIPIVVSDGTNSQTVNVPVSAPLHSLPNGVRDELDVSGGKIIRWVGKFIFDGSEDERWMVNVPWDAQYTNIAHAQSLVSWNWKVGQTGALCNKFEFATEKTGRDLGKEQSSCHTTNAGFTLQISRSRIPEYTTDLTKKQREVLVEAWLSANPVTILYELAEPVIETIPPIDIPLYYPDCTITTTDETEPEMHVAYNRDLNATLQALQDAIETITGG
jgi:hypothetical protein